MPEQNDMDRQRRGSTPSEMLSLLSSASDLLSTSLAPEDAVRSFVRLVVPALADWSLLTLVDQDGRPHDVESWHRDPAKRTLIVEFARQRLSGRTDEVGSLAALKNGRPFILWSGARAFAQQTLRSWIAARLCPDWSWNRSRSSLCRSMDESSA